VIGRIRGELIELDGNLATIEAGGIGYEVLLPESIALQMPNVGEAATVIVRQVFREDGTSLYGFLERGERHLFDLLLEVQGCGPKVALALIGQLGQEGVVSGIVTQDARSLQRANGVGPRLAERIVLELREKVTQKRLLDKAAVAARGANGRPPDELVEALLSLGYRRGEAENAAAEVRGESDALDEQIKAALRKLQR